MKIEALGPSFERSLLLDGASSGRSFLSEELPLRGASFGRRFLWKEFLWKELPLRVASSESSFL